MKETVPKEVLVRLEDWDSVGNNIRKITRQNILQMKWRILLQSKKLAQVTYGKQRRHSFT